MQQALPENINNLPFRDEIPGMVGKAECQYLYWLAGERGNQPGAIAEVGSWLGRSAWHMASGAQRTVHCFDNFIWKKEFANKAGFEHEPGTCYQHLFEKNTKDTEAVAHKVEIGDLQWRLGDINLLHVDSAKHTREVSQLLTAVRNHLVPGSVIVFQDYCHELSFELPFAIAVLKDYLKPLHCPGGGTVSFEVVKQLPADALRLEQLSQASFERDEWIEIWAMNKAKFDGYVNERLNSGLAFLMADRGYHWHAFKHILSSTLTKRKMLTFRTPRLYAMSVKVSSPGIDKTESLEITAEPSVDPHLSYRPRNGNKLDVWPGHNTP